MTVTEMAAKLGIEPNAVRQRLYVAGIKPIVKEALYAPDALERIRDVPGKGRPRKKPDAGE
jgi:predicted ArsR family transcriptional regulator